MLKKIAEGLNNVTVQTNVCTCGYLTADVGETYKSRKRMNIGQIRERRGVKLTEYVGVVGKDTGQEEHERRI